MGRIAVTDGLAKAAVAKLVESGHEVVEEHISADELEGGALTGFDAIIVRSATKLTAPVIEASEGLKVIGRAGVGIDNIDIEAANAKDIVVVNAPLASTQSVVELTIGHLLASTRKLAECDRGLRKGKWQKKEMVGTELAGKALGLIGFGRIAQKVAKVAEVLGMEIHAYDPYLPGKVGLKLGARMHDDIDELFRMCTHISVHCNLSEETYHLVNEKRLSLMPNKGADGVSCGNHLVNCARGGIVDEDAVFKALQSNILASAALDVFEVEPVKPDHPLLKHPSFHGTPHIGAATLEAQVRVGHDIVNAVDAAMRGELVETQINREILDKE